MQNRTTTKDVVMNALQKESRKGLWKESNKRRRKQRGILRAESLVVVVVFEVGRFPQSVFML